MEPQTLYRALELMINIIYVFTEKHELRTFDKI